MYFNVILIDAGKKYPVNIQEKESVIEEVMRRGLDEPHIAEEKKARWRAFIARGIAKTQYDANEEKRRSYIKKRVTLGVKEEKFNKKELKEIYKLYAGNNNRGGITNRNTSNGNGATSSDSTRAIRGGVSSSKNETNRKLKESSSRSNIVNEIQRQLASRFTS